MFVGHWAQPGREVDPQAGQPLGVGAEETGVVRLDGTEHNGRCLVVANAGEEFDGKAESRPLLAPVADSFPLGDHLEQGRRRSRRTVLAGPLTQPTPGFEGPLYRLWPLCCVVGEATVSIGVAASAVDAFVELARTKTPAYQAVPLRDQQLAHDAAGKARARVDAARHTLHMAAAEAYDETAASGQLLSWEAKTRLQLAACFAAEACAEAVRLVHDAAGSSAFRLEQPFERHFRDIHVLTQHSSKSSPRYAPAGRLLFGLENDWIWLSF